MMNNVIYNNAYGLLGLLPNSTQKEITRRNKEIEKFIQIGEVPEYSFDFDFYNQARNLQNIRNAFFNISNINNQILHHFFRVYANTETQLEILEEIENNFSSEQIIKIYENISKKNFIIKKNFAIILTIFLLSEKADNAEEIADYCINLWYSVIYNEKYIKDYKKIFLLDDELGIEESLLNDILESIVKELTKVFSDISKFYNNNQILSAFIDKFQLNDTIFSLDTVEEIYDNIYKSIKILDNLNISEDGVFDNDEKRTLKTCLQNFQEEFNKLIDLGLYENEKTVILRDLVATKIRIQILDLFNNLAEDETALNLMKFAIYIVGTKGLNEKLFNELKILQKYNSPIDVIKIGRNTTITIFNKHLEIDGTQIPFDDIQSVSYLLHTTRTNGIETERTYNFTLGTKIKTFDLTQNLGLFSNKKDAETTFYKLLSIAEFVTPILVEKFYASILNGKTLKIEKLYITKDSYYIRKWNGDKIVRITPQLSTPQIKEGKVILYNEQGSSFFEISLNSSNAPILFELIKKIKGKGLIANKIYKDFCVKSDYGLHVFNKELETDSERKWIYFCDFLGDLFGWLFIIAFISGIIWLFTN